MTSFYPWIWGKEGNIDKTLTSLRPFFLQKSIPTSPSPWTEIEEDYTFFIRRGDSLSLHAKQWLTLFIQDQHPDILYSDETLQNNTGRQSIDFLKPDASIEMFFSMNYFGNLLCIKTALLKNLPSLESKTYENFLYEILLNIDIRNRKIIHIREKLYIRHDSSSVVKQEDFFKDLDSTKAREHLEAYCKRHAMKASIEFGPYHGTFRIKHVLEKKPLVSIIVPFRDKPDLLAACIHSVLEKTSYENIEIIGINNGSKEQATLGLMQTLKEQDKRISFYDYDIPFNYSKINNYAVHHAKGEHLLFLNNDTVVIEPMWIEALLEYSQQAEIGIVGAKLLYPDESIQHCGVVCHSYADHIFKELPNHEPGYFYFPHIVRNYHLLTFACVMMKKTVFQQVGGLYESLAVDFNDVDICARVSQLGFRNVYTPYAVLYHNESKTRGGNHSPEQLIRNQWEWITTAERSPAIFLHDSMSHESIVHVAWRECIAMQNTLSWKLTRPLRLAKKLLKQFKKRK